MEEKKKTENKRSPIETAGSFPLQSGVIKPCPFCGSKAELKKGNGVQCTNKAKCGIVGPRYGLKDNLTIEAWNKRAL